MYGCFLNPPLYHRLHGNYANRDTGILMRQETYPDNGQYAPAREETNRKTEGSRTRSYSLNKQKIEPSDFPGTLDDRDLELQIYASAL